METNELQKKLEEISKVGTAKFKEKGKLPLFIYFFLRVKDNKNNGEMRNTMNEIQIPEKVMNARFDYLRDFGKFMRENKNVVGKAEKAFGLEIEKIEAVGAASEAWMSMMSKKQGEEAERTGDFPRPSQDPQRREVLIFNIMSELGESHCKMFTISSKQRKVKEMKDDGDGNGINKSESRLLSAFWDGFLTKIK